MLVQYLKLGHNRFLPYPLHFMLQYSSHQSTLVSKLLRILQIKGIIYYYLVREAIRTAATPGLLCQPRVIMKITVEKQMECRLTGETKVLGDTLPQRHFCPSQNPTWPDPGLNPGRRGGKPATNSLSYGTAFK
jgi:hypothetical protein